MAKTKKETFEELKKQDDVEVIVPTRGPLAEREVIVKEAPQKSVVPSEPLVPFDRWFASKGFKERWKSGMVAFTDVSIRRTMSEWDQIFSAY